MNRFCAYIKPVENANSHNTVKIEAKIEERAFAQQIFDDAVKQNKAAILGQVDKAAPDIFEISLGAIPIGHLVEVEYDYLLDAALTDAPVTEMRDTETAMAKETLLHIPMTTKARYVNSYSTSAIHNSHSNRDRDMSISISQSLKYFAVRPKI